MNPLGNRARAHELARLLDGAVAGPSSSTASYATLATRLRALSAVIDPAPAPDFRDALRQRLLAVASVQDLGPEADTESTRDRLVRWTRTWNAQRRLAASAAVMAAVVAVTGMAIASSRSLPGQPFYGLKRVAEDVQLSLAGSDTEKGTKHLEFAATRLREVRALTRGDGQLALSGTGTLAGSTALGGSVSSRIRSTLEDFREETTEGSALLEKVYRSTGKKEPLRVLTSFARQQQSRLTAILPELRTAEATQAAEASLELVTEVGTEANELLGFQACDVACAPGPDPAVPTEPVPSPGASASPTEVPEGTDGGDGGATPTPEPTPGPTESSEPEPSPEPTPEPEPTTSPEPTPSPTATPASSPEPALLPDPVMSLLPEPVRSLLPTTAPELPLPMPAVLPPLDEYAVTER